jgi:Na+-transporting NADH:ubiquinone oxidoreductase subunit NqrA
MHRGLLTKTNLLTTLYAGAPLEVVENLQSIEDEERYMSRWKRFGRITLQTKTIFGMRMNIKYIIKEKSLKEAFFWLNLHFKNIRNTNIL